MIKVKSILVLTVLFTVASTFSGCNKYEDGANVSLISAKKRLSRDWKLTNLTKNGVNQNIEGYTQFLSFAKSGSYNQSVTAQTVWGPATVAENGSWNLSADKKFVNLTKEGESTALTYRLLELRKSQFKVKYTDDGDEYTRTFVEK